MRLTGQIWPTLTVRDPERSAAWYEAVLGVARLREFRGDDGRLVQLVLRHPSGLQLCLQSHAANDNSPFDERRTGLDHLEFVVPSPEDVEAWARRLDRLGVSHSGVKDFSYTAGVMVTFRDPDNIQLEFYALRR